MATPWARKLAKKAVPPWQKVPRTAASSHPWDRGYIEESDDSPSVEIVGDNLDDNVDDHVDDNIDDHVDDHVDDNIDDNIDENNDDDNVDDNIDDNVDDNVDNNIDDNFDENNDDNIDENNDDKIDDNIDEEAASGDEQVIYRRGKEAYDLQDAGGTQSKTKLQLWWDKVGKKKGRRQSRRKKTCSNTS